MQLYLRICDEKEARTNTLGKEEKKRSVLFFSLLLIQYDIFPSSSNLKNVSRVVKLFINEKKCIVFKIAFKSKLSRILNDRLNRCLLEVSIPKRKIGNSLRKVFRSRLKNIIKKRKLKINVLP